MKGAPTTSMRRWKQLPLPSRKADDDSFKSTSSKGDNDSFKSNGSRMDDESFKSAASTVVGDDTSASHGISAAARQTGCADSRQLARKSSLLPPPGQRPPAAGRSLTVMHSNNFVEKAAKERREKAAALIQSVARGNLARKFRLARLAAHEQRTAVEHLRAQRHVADPGKRALPASSGKGQNYETSRSRTKPYIVDV